MFFVGERDLEVDWLDDARNYTCYHPERTIMARKIRLRIIYKNQEQFFLNLYFHKYSNGNNTVLKTTLKAAFSAEFSTHNNKRSF
jgi:hypothetical protein